MPSLSTLLRLLLIVTLMVNGIASAVAKVHELPGGAHPTVAVGLPTTKPACHGMQGHNGDAPTTDEHAGNPHDSADSACCGSNQCADHCLHAGAVSLLGAQSLATMGKPQSPVPFPSAAQLPTPPQSDPMRPPIG